MIHSFNTEIAEMLGIEKAILLQNISYWIAKNIANNTHNVDGITYTYNSYEAFTELFPYMKINTIKRVIRELEDDGILLSRNDLNGSPYDKTKWYSIAKNSNVFSLLFDSQKNNHRQSEKSPCTITDYKTQIGAPTEEQVIAMAKKLKIPEETALKFYLYYEGIGWRRVNDFVPLLRKWDMENRSKEEAKANTGVRLWA